MKEKLFIPIAIIMCVCVHIVKGHLRFHVKFKTKIPKNFQFNCLSNRFICKREKKEKKIAYEQPKNNNNGLSKSFEIIFLNHFQKKKQKIARKIPRKKAIF